MDDVDRDTVMADKDQTPSQDTGGLDLVGGPFAVIESDPGVFTTLLRTLGVRGLEVVELYDIEPWAINHLKPHGLIFCFLWHKDTHRAQDFADPAAERVWFANQLSQDSCASAAVLNVLLNCPGCDVGPELEAFRAETEEMSSVMKGLAISNSHFIREAHNSLARPADIRGALNSIARTTLDASKKSQSAKPPPSKRRKTTTASRDRPSKPAADSSEDDEVYHFIGYVPAHGKVWELDGLKSGPLEVGELESGMECWMDVARPALRMKMEKYGGRAEGAGDIRFSLLAVVDDGYMAASDRLEMLKRERIALERRLDAECPGWRNEIDPMLENASEIFTTALQSDVPGPTYSAGFGHDMMQKQVAILSIPQDRLKEAWTACVNSGLQAKVAVEDEISKARTGHDENIQRTHDFEPFIREYIKHLHQEGLLNPLLGRDENGRHIPANAKSKGKAKG
ncbi:hypothetical protein EWM64_g7722 [Hericium alpestre]|uniref:ubiquitinyl hydrolase 1 n=1 Tax=Hericium alpestre TaxID=135208 RepID=A0A4Y9ZS16_9AGAM|nr:hypothetical protein EWM64_g7722 [Hericium alpestre]